MLIQFVVQNFLSFQKETIFKMTASSDPLHADHIYEDTDQKLRLLKCSGIYGANGSGKTNLVEALEFVKDLVLRGIKPNQGIPTRRFKLSKASLVEPSRFELEILHKEVLYSYGIVVDDKHVKEEWLFATKPKGREVRLFERITSDTGEVKIEVGVQLGDAEQGKDFLSFVAQGTRPEQPFLSEAESRNVKSVHELMAWFRKRLNILHCSAVYGPLPMRIHKDKQFTKTLGLFLKSIGTGIEKIETEEMDLDFDKHFPELPEEARRDVLAGLDGNICYVFGAPAGDDDLGLITGTKENPKTIKVFTVHKGKDQSEVRFAFSEESSGTQRAMHLFPTLFSVIVSEGTFVIDELDRSLHPLLSRRFLESFLKSSNPRAQLIFTTHEASLLDLDLLRRDEIWFVEKDKEQSSHCYPLTDFKVRPDLEIRKGYLRGRFGAIPFFQKVDNLGWAEAKA